MIANQVGWSFAERNPNFGDPTMRFMDAETYAFHAATGLMAAAYSSQANGFFAGPYGRGILPPTPGVRPGVVHDYYNDTNFGRLERTCELAAQRGCTPNDIALGYLISQPFPTCALIGCGTLEHLNASCDAGDMLLTPEEVTRLAGS